MNRQLRRVSVLVLLLFVALFASTSIIQVFEADSLRTDPRNSRTLYQSFSAQRGSILVDGKAIAQSTASDDLYKYLREYTDGKIYAPATGFFSVVNGSTGIESSLNDYLSGTANAQFLDKLGSLLSGQDPKGASVELTLDASVQKAAYDALGTRKGAVVAIDPKTGAILAMVSTPSYDPNTLAGHNTSKVSSTYAKLSANSGTPLINRAIAGDLYHPGSVFKLVVATAALESGKYTLDSTFPNPRTLQLPQSSTSISNIGGGVCGGGKTVSIATALRLSCNIPMAELGLALGYDAINATAKKLGYGDTFHVPMAVTPSLYPSGMDDAQLMLSSFGQYDDRVTPLQVALTSAAIANGGQLMQPTLVKRIIAPDLTELQTLTPTVYSTAMSASSASAMTTAMVADVANGVASNARISGVDVAGKTGTAENGTGQSNTLWFTGFAPAKDPQVAVAVVLEDGGGEGANGVGNLVAAPIAKKVMEAVLNR